MTKTCVLVVGGVGVCALAYGGGYWAGRLRCRADVAMENSHVVLELIKKQEVIDAESYSRGDADIRRWLREKYTITE